MSAARTEGPRSRRAGDRIGKKLELVARLGEGGMGAIWVARNLTTEAEVAIKVLRAHREDDGHAAERFRHEARLGAMLAHRNITRVFDLLEDDDGSLVLVMELLHGQTLEATYKARPGGVLSCREAVEIIVPVLGALQHAHEHGVVHRDVKPSNIFMHVDPDGHTTPKLLDFGIAKTHDASVLTRTGEALGSPSYMSPEQVRAMKQLDARSDVFSVGVVLYEIITGENPFHAPSPTAMLAQVLELEVDPDPRIDPRVWLEIQRALSKQAYERHASASELAEALSRAVGLERAAPASTRQVVEATTTTSSSRSEEARSRLEEARSRSRSEEAPSAGLPTAAGVGSAVRGEAAEPRDAGRGRSSRGLVIALVGTVVAAVAVIAIVFMVRAPAASMPKGEPRGASDLAEAGRGASGAGAAPGVPATPAVSAARGEAVEPASSASASTSHREPGGRRPPVRPSRPASTTSTAVPPVARTPGF